MSENISRGEVEIKLNDDVTRTMRMRFNAMRKIEKHFGRSIFELFSGEAALRQLKIEDIMVIFQSALVDGGHKDMTLDQLGDLMDFNLLGYYIERLGKLLNRGTTGSDEVAKESPLELVEKKTAINL